MVGNTVGPALGRKVGVADAGIDGSKVGVDDGTPVGVFVGAGVGARVGLIVGASVAGINPSSNIRCSFKMRVFFCRWYREHPIPEPRKTASKSDPNSLARR